MKETEGLSFDLYSGRSFLTRFLSSIFGKVRDTDEASFLNTNLSVWFSRARSLFWCSLDILQNLSDKIGKANKFVFEYGG